MQLPEGFADTFCNGDPRKEEKLAGSVSSGAAIRMAFLEHLWNLLEAHVGA